MKPHQQKAKPMNDRCRKEFEARFEHLELTRITDSGGYNSKITNRTWIGFKAAWKAAKKVDIEKGAQAIRECNDRDKPTFDDCSKACADAWGLEYEGKE